MAEHETEHEGPWLPPVPERVAPDPTTRLNYVIPARLETLLAQYCAQTQMKPGPLVRRLIGDYLNGEVLVDLTNAEHPRGRRTSVDLSQRLLAALEARCEQNETTKAALIAALLRDFLPPRVDQEGIEKVTAEVPASIFTKIYERYGPGPHEDVLVEALCDLIQKNESKAVPAEAEA